MLQPDDVVFWRDDQVPSFVMRAGYGPYECKVRIAFVHENRHLHGVGRWVCSADCYKLEPGDKIVATANVIDASENRNKITAGTLCRFCGFDEDGDFLICIGAGRMKNRRLTIFREELLKFSLQ